MQREIRKAERLRKKRQTKVKQEQESEETVSCGPIDTTFIKVEPVDNGYEIDSSIQNLASSEIYPDSNMVTKVELGLRVSRSSMSSVAFDLHGSSVNPFHYQNDSSNNFYSNSPVSIKMETDVEDSGFTVPTLNHNSNPSNNHGGSYPQNTVGVNVEWAARSSGDAQSVPNFCIKAECDDDKNEVKQSFGPAGRRTVCYSLRNR